MSNWLDLILNGNAGAPIGSPHTILFTLLLAFVTGQVVAWVYIWSHQFPSYSQTFVMSLVVLPPIVALLMLLMAGSLMVAFGLLAVFAVVRFRNVLKDTRDTTFVLWSIIQGMAVGTTNYTTAWVGAMGIAFIILFLRLTSFGRRHRFDAELSLQLTGDLAHGFERLNSVLYRHTSKALLSGERRISDEGVDLAYRLRLRNPDRFDEFRLDLNQTEGIEYISLNMRQGESEV